MTAVATSKAVKLPVEGDYLTDGKRLVEVVAKEREGFRVLDATVPLTIGPKGRDPRASEILSVETVAKHWRHVEPKDEDG